MQSSTYFLPSEIERETGFGKEQLRKWRQRFGFPPKESNVDGKIAYSGQTVEQLHLIRRLLEAGFRPAQVVGKTVLELEKLKLELGLNAVVYAPDESIVSLIEYIKLNDLKGFLSLLIKKRGKQIMLDFVQNTIAPLMIGIGEAWRRDEIDIHHEHLCSAHIERYLHAEILRLRPREGYQSFCWPFPQESIIYWGY